VAGVPEITGASFTFITVIEKTAKDAVSFDVSITLIAISSKDPTSLLLGIPVSPPVEILKLAQEGLFSILKVRLSFSASLTVGVNEYSSLS
jgi:hypothetical protein